MRQGDEYLDLRLGDFLERLGAGNPAPGSGSASALTVAIAAGLVAMVARRSEDCWEESPGIAAQALALQARAAPLALADARVWDEALEALAAVREDAATPNGELEAEARPLRHRSGADRRDRRRHGGARGTGRRAGGRHVQVGRRRGRRARCRGSTSGGASRRGQPHRAGRRRAARPRAPERGDSRKRGHACTRLLALMGV